MENEKVIERMEMLEEAKKVFKEDKFATKAAGVEIVEVGEKYAKVKMTLQSIHYNAVGGVMGGAMFTMADFAFAVATNFRQSATVTLTSSIQYLSGVKGKELYAETKLIKDGRRNCFYDIMITDDLGTKVALVNITGAHL